LNSHILFLNGYRTPEGDITCYARRSNPGYIYPQWERVHLVVYNLCPFAIMCICNTYIIYVTFQSSRVQIEIASRECRRKSIERYRQFTALLIIVTFAFVLLTLPACIYFVFFRHNLVTKHPRNYRFMIQILLNSIQFTSHGINFFLYCFSANSFRHELCEMFRGLITKCRWICRNTRQDNRKRRYVNRNYLPSTFEHRQRELKMNNCKFSSFPEF
jgi:hypothetical protein